GTMGYWGFKPFANCKNTSKEPLKYHFRNNGCWGFKPSPLVKIRVRSPSNAI
ncbi:Hypothetical protein FKW44_025273, partial [Caligus rogercresseyi]